jgi:ribosome biogenesis protein SSF1/2
LLRFNFVYTFARAGYGSESEVDDEAAMVSLPSDVDKLNRASRKSAVRLQEIGPRMTMRLVKVEAGLCSGDVLYPWPGEFHLML